MKKPLDDEHSPWWTLTERVKRRKAGEKNNAATKKELAKGRKVDCPNPMAANSNSSDACKRKYCKKAFTKYDVDPSTGKSLIPPGVPTHVDSCIGAALSGLPRKWWAPSQVHRSLVAQGHARQRKSNDKKKKRDPESTSDGGPCSPSESPPCGCSGKEGSPSSAWLAECRRINNLDTFTGKTKKKISPSGKIKEKKIPKEKRAKRRDPRQVDQELDPCEKDRGHCESWPEDCYFDERTNCLRLWGLN